MTRGGPCAAFSPSAPAKNPTRWTLASRIRSRLPSSCFPRAHGHPRLSVVGHYDLGPASPRIAYTLPSPSTHLSTPSQPRTAGPDKALPTCTMRRSPLPYRNQLTSPDLELRRHKPPSTMPSSEPTGNACARLRDTLPGGPAACNSSPVAS